MNARLKFSNSSDKINNGKGKGIPIDKDMEIERLRKQFMAIKPILVFHLPKVVKLSIQRISK